jgi:hypothetical protein
LGFLFNLGGWRFNSLRALRDLLRKPDLLRVGTEAIAVMHGERRTRYLWADIRDIKIDNGRVYIALLAEESKNRHFVCLLE